MHTESPIILASGSPRRLEILNKHGIHPIINPASVNEDLPDGIGMEDAVRFLSFKKARAVEDDLPEEAEASERPAVILAADTVVYEEELGILGKPQNQDDAFRMLSHLRGKEHQVATGCTLLVAGYPVRRVFCDITDVYFKDYTDEEIWAYIDTGEPFDKAGAYAIQGEFGKHVDHIDGAFDNVVGLPFDHLEEEFKIIEEGLQKIRKGILK